MSPKRFDIGYLFIFMSYRVLPKKKKIGTLLAGLEGALSNICFHSILILLYFTHCSAIG